MYLTHEEILIIMDANASYLSIDTPENLYKFLKNIPAAARGSIIEFCYNDLKYPILDKLNVIPAKVFLNCDLNFKWTAGPNLTQIDVFAFSYCKFDTLDWSKAKITELSDKAFLWSDIKNVILPEGLKKIGMKTFIDSDTEEVYIPSTVESIGAESFYGCEHLKKVHLCKDSIAQNKLKIDQDDFNIIKPKVVLY